MPGHCALVSDESVSPFFGGFFSAGVDRFEQRLAQGSFLAALARAGEVQKEFHPIARVAHRVLHFGDVRAGARVDPAPTPAAAYARARDPMLSVVVGVTTRAVNRTASGFKREITPAFFGKSL